MTAGAEPDRTGSNCVASLGDRVVVGRATLRVRLVRFPGQTFFSTLRRKLG
jgi:hypothetical protein